jgi:clan AA aspartic protease (TIGR02281 family)
LRVKLERGRADAEAMRSSAQIAAAALIVAGLCSPARGDIYRWTDADGRVHFTQDLSRVPARARAEAERSARAETRGAPSSSAPPSALARFPRARFRAGGAIEIPFERQGNAMVVYARINDAITAPFIVDTGASDVVIPAHVARAAGIVVAPDAPRQTYQTANGVIESPVVSIGSVEVGAARVENVRGSLSDGMSVGLLGGTFFNHFTMKIDPAEESITLYPNAQVKGGAGQAEWRARFTEIRRDLAALDAHLAGGALINDDRVRTLAEKRAGLVAALEALEQEANAAGVPQAWRE